MLSEASICYNALMNVLNILSHTAWFQSYIEWIMLGYGWGAPRRRQLVPSSVSTSKGRVLCARNVPTSFPTQGWLTSSTGWVTVRQRSTGLAIAEVVLQVCIPFSIEHKWWDLICPGWWVACTCCPSKKSGMWLYPAFTKPPIKLPTWWREGTCLDCEEGGGVFRRLQPAWEEQAPPGHQLQALPPPRLALLPLHRPRHRPCHPPPHLRHPAHHLRQLEQHWLLLPLCHPQLPLAQA